MGALLGKDAKLYRQTSGTRAAWPGTGFAPDLKEISNVRDLTDNLDTALADVTTRGSGNFRAQLPTLSDASLDFQMIMDTADADFNAIKDAYINRSVIAMAALSQGKGVNGSFGLWADMRVSNMTLGQALEDGQLVDVTLVNTPSIVAAELVTVVGT